MQSQVDLQHASCDAVVLCIYIAILQDGTLHVCAESSVLQIITTKMPKGIVRQQ